MSKSMSVEGQMQDLLKGIDNEVKEVYKKSAEAVARDTVQELRNTSPKKTGDYAKGWSKKKNKDGEIVVYNKTDWQLTHLLENGHVIKNKKGTYGRTRGKKHIAPARDKAEQALLVRISEGIK